MSTSELRAALGRLNRYAEKDDPWSCMIFPFQGLPYNEDSAKLLSHGDYRIEMAATRKAVSELAGQPCNQRELARRSTKWSQPRNSRSRLVGRTAG